VLLVLLLLNDDDGGGAAGLRLLALGLVLVFLSKLDCAKIFLL